MASISSQRFGGCIFCSKPYLTVQLQIIFIKSNNRFDGPGACYFFAANFLRALHNYMGFSYEFDDPWSS